MEESIGFSQDLPDMLASETLDQHPSLKRIGLQTVAEVLARPDQPDDVPGFRFKVMKNKTAGTKRRTAMFMRRGQYVFRCELQGMRIGGG